MLGMGSMIVGAALAAANAYSSHKTNQTNRSIANQNNALAMELANTAHQREVKDLQEAGLNPILSADGSGATTPQLATAQLQAPQIDMNTITSAINAMTQKEVGDAQANNLNANSRKTNIEAELAPKIAEAQIQLNIHQGNLAKENAIKSKLEADIQDIQKKYYKDSGTAPNMSHTDREIMGLINAGKKGGNAIAELMKDAEDWNFLHKWNNHQKEYWDRKSQSFKRY